jgi:hypothetical protein
VGQLSWDFDRTVACCRDDRHQWGHVRTDLGHTKGRYLVNCFICNSDLWWEVGTEPPQVFKDSLGNGPLEVVGGAPTSGSCEHAWLPDEIEGNVVTRYYCPKCSAKKYTTQAERTNVKSRIPKSGMVKVQNISPSTTEVVVNGTSLDGVHFVTFTHAVGEVPRVEVEFNHDKDGSLIFEGHMWARRPPEQVVALVEEHHGPISQTEPGCICGDEFDGSLIGHIADVAYDYATGNLSGDLPPIQRGALQ